MTAHAFSLLFAAVLANQAGVPLPVVPSLVEQSMSTAPRGRFRAHQFAFLFGGPFVPELNPIAAGMPGATRMRPGRSSAVAIASALAWAGVWTGVGYAVGNVTRQAPVPLLPLATPVVVIGSWR